MSTKVSQIIGRYEIYKIHVNGTNARRNIPNSGSKQRQNIPSKGLKWTHIYLGVAMSEKQEIQQSSVEIKHGMLNMRMKSIPRKTKTRIMYHNTKINTKKK